MPLYEYQCDACGHRFEVIQKFSDPPIDTCPKCGSTVHKLFSSPAIQFKGSGWYITDYAKKDSAAAGKSDSPSSSGSKEGSSDKGEKGEKGEKPATGSETKSDAPKTSDASSSSSSAPAKTES